MKDAIAAWTSIGATGKAEQLSEKHEWLLKTATTSRTVDVGCQTMDSLLGINRHHEPEQIAVQSQAEDERKQHWIEQNGVTAGERSLDISGVGLGKMSLFFFFFFFNTYVVRHLLTSG